MTWKQFYEENKPVLIGICVMAVVFGIIAGVCIFTGKSLGVE